MARKKRKKIEIVRDILECLTHHEKLKQTKIMYKANLSHTQLINYFSELEERNFIYAYNYKSYRYIQITPKGRDHLANYLNPLINKLNDLSY